ncbi:DUF397 domain-containing protein [Streptomyces albus]|uniref:DUF397 domain-containing protein n=1 Tax=Streptomyces albus TaxID=1888 RepID=UPI0013B49BEE|nr:DUF397 domain-containing protein [Streptomyces albus]QID37720.1 DUF397 domain-containing protein [Streptomyces albus]GHJ19557.1 hypothetical protein TPA0909_11710 [Streptomyces albus]GHJ19578.1 hypothetical protein TPA0909_11920 [Streptomyces albus]GHJ23713.1 hypothetical protein TPA0909_53270 [Streptomyces albus]
MALQLSAEDGAAWVWKKSSYSSNDGPSCVEVAATAGAVHVRDSKDAFGPRLTFRDGTWAAFVPYVVVDAAHDYGCRTPGTVQSE